MNRLRSLLSLLSCSLLTGFSGCGGDGGEVCDPSLFVLEDGTPDVAAPDGIFVSTTGSDSATGTLAAPMLTIQAALAKASMDGLTYVFVAGGAYDEQLTLSSGDSLLGGFNESENWARCVSTPTTVIGASPAISAYTIAGAYLEEINVHTPAGGVGESNYAVWIQSSTGVEFVGGELRAGLGGPGAPGAAFTMAAADAQDGDPGADARQHATDFENTGGSGGAAGCGCTSGGAGGEATALGAGSPEPGKIEDGMSCTDDLGGMVGGPGDVGVDGSSGAGGAEMGAFSASGYATADGTNGTAGTSGGGGWGSDTRPTAVVICPDDERLFAPSGAGGGGGGCGGQAGNGGQGGGASIALYLWNAEVSLEDVAVTTDGGGTGGDGSAGQVGGNGGSGGLGGSGDSMFCSGGGGQFGPTDSLPGGDGGAGGQGGGGGGGGGGPTYGIVYGGASPIPSPATLDVEVGLGGPGGSGGVAATGAAAATLTVSP